MGKNFMIQLSYISHKRQIRYVSQKSIIIQQFFLPSKVIRACIKLQRIIFFFEL